MSAQPGTSVFRRSGRRPPPGSRTNCRRIPTRGARAVRENESDGAMPPMYRSELTFPSVSLHWRVSARIVAVETPLSWKLLPGAVGVVNDGVAPIVVCDAQCMLSTYV